MAYGGIRFIQNGWIEKLYIEPQFFFKYYGFEWVEVLNPNNMYILLYLIIGSALFVALGLFYRLAIIVFFCSFTYLQLIDATNYLNHYYLVCLLAFLLLFLPANRAFSLDVLFGFVKRKTKVPAWTINILIFQLCVVYTFAGIAKLNSDWLFRAMPMAIWLPERADFPVLGSIFALKWTPFLASWFAAFYDLTIAYFLMSRYTRNTAYIFVLVFHVMTYLLFNIGLFPIIMIFSTLIFFPATKHEAILQWFGYKGNSGGSQSLISNISIIKNITDKFPSIGGMPKAGWVNTTHPCPSQEGNFSKTNSLLSIETENPYSFKPFAKAFLYPLMGTYIAIQLLLPLRHLAYPGNVLWTEEGYRFSWRVMLVEKNGQAIFTITEPKTGRKSEINNKWYLTKFQEKQMSIQPDFMVQYAKFLKQEQKEKHGIENAIVTVDSYVALNARAGKRFIDSDRDLAKE